MHADANITNIKLHASELFCTQVTAENFFRFATCTQPVFADDRRWHADFPVPATHDRTKIYTYDGMRHKGYPVHSLEMTFDIHMAGKKPKIPRGFIIWEAIYSLRGGLMVQEKFYQIRIKKYAAQYNLSFSEVTLNNLTLK